MVISAARALQLHHLALARCAGQFPGFLPALAVGGADDGHGASAKK
jgi:hypothetical protein